MRYILKARVRPGRRESFRRSLEDGTFGAGFPYGDLGAVLAGGRVDDSGAIRWVEVCYCREAYGVAMEEELPYLEEYLTDITITDARNPQHCEGYPVCGTCRCSQAIRFEGEPLLARLRRQDDEPEDSGSGQGGRPPRWLGWRGRVSPEEDRRNREGRVRASRVGAGGLGAVDSLEEIE